MKDNPMKFRFLLLHFCEVSNQASKLIWKRGRYGAIQDTVRIQRIFLLCPIENKNDKKADDNMTKIGVNKGWT